MEYKEQFKNWYWNRDIEKREFILWEILKEIRSHSTDMINIDKQIHPKRFQAIGSFHFLISRFIPSMFVQRIDDDDNKIPVKHPRWNFFRSIQHCRFVKDGEKVNIQTEFDKLTYGWDLIIDFDNKSFKKWVNDNLQEILEKHDIEIIFRKVMEGIIQPYDETKILKEYLDKLEVPYILNFTGSGFRIAIYWSDLKDYFSSDDYGVMNVKLGKFIVDQALKDKQEAFDSSTLGFGMGVTHTMFSLHPTTLLVRFPLSDNEFNDFDLEAMKPEVILERIGNDIKPSAKPYNHKRSGDLSHLYAEFKQNVDVDKHQLEKEKKVVLSQKNKDVVLNTYNQLSQKDKDDVLSQMR